MKKSAVRKAPVRLPQPFARHLPPQAGPELLRRVLLGLITALIVARPLVIGEDPGLTDHLSDPSSLVITLLWLVAAAGWAVWRAWSGRTSWRGSAVEACLLVVVVVVFVSAGQAAYKHPAWLIAWEWAVFLVVFCLVRQLFRGSEGQRLFAAMLAGGVCISAQAIHQYTVELPQLRASLGTASGGTLQRQSDSQNLRDKLAQLRALGTASGGTLQLQSDYQKLRDKLASIGVSLEPDDPQLKAWDDRFHENNVFGTFAHPNSLAGYLALLLPGAVAAAFVCWRKRLPYWHTALTACCAGVIGAALWFTHSRGGILGTLLIAMAALAILGRRWLWQRRWWIAPALLLLIVATWILVRPASGGRAGEKARESLAKAAGSLSLRRDYWQATWAMIHDHFWLGVGPGNFDRYYPRYMLARAFEKIKDPHNFALEIWATCGVIAMAAFLAALAALLWHVVRALLSKRPQIKVPEATTQEYGIPWEFYLGGLAGIMLAYILWASGQIGPQTGDSLLVGGMTAALRVLVWFGAFALLERTPWANREFGFGLAAGLGALLLNLLISGGVSFPSVAQPMWVVVALGLNAFMAAPGPPIRRASWLKVALPVPLTLATCVIYVAWIFLPVTSSAALANEARSRSIGYSHEVQTKGLGNYDYLRKYVIDPLKESVKRDPGDISPRLDLLHWYEERYAAYERTLLEDQEMKSLVKEIQRLDPEGSSGYMAEYQMWLRFAGRLDDPSGKPTAESAKKYAAAVDAMAEVVRRDPTEARFHYDLGEVLLKAGKRKEAILEFRRAYGYHKLSQNVTRRLSDRQLATLLLAVNLPPAP